MKLCVVPFLVNTNNISSSICYYHWNNNKLLMREYATRQMNILLWICWISITLVLLNKLNNVFRLWAKGNLIPGPPCTSFLGGHANLISNSNLTHLLSKSHKKYGSVVKLWLGPTQLLVSIKSPEVIKEMLAKAEDKFPLTGRAFHLAFGRSSFFVSSFDKVRERRNSLERALNQKLLSRTNVSPLKIVNCVMERVQNVMAKGGLDCEMVSQHMAFTIMGATIFGDVFLSWSDAVFYEELFMLVAKEACFWGSYTVTPLWKQGFWNYQHLCTKLGLLTQEIIKKCRQANNPNNGHKSSSFLWEFDGHLDENEEPCGNIVSMMFHGSLTTAGLIGNIMARLARNPDIQDKIHSEIIVARKSSKEQGQQEVGKMPFLLATVYESARLLPAAPLLQRCSLKHDIKLQTGDTIPAGAILVVPVQLVQVDDSYWGSDASQFNPYRFLSKSEKRPERDQETPFPGSPEELVDSGCDSYVLHNPNENTAFLPFGSGARACVGQKLAILGVAKLFASLLEHYEIRLQPECASDPKPMMNNGVLHLLPSPKIAFLKRS